MISFVVFCAVTYAIAFLAADAKIFGMSAYGFPEEPVPSDFENGGGLFPIRQIFLKLGFFRKLLGCYFCLGIWSGPAAHLLLLLYGQENQDWMNSYFLGNVVGTLPFIMGCGIAAFVGATVSFVIDSFIIRQQSSVGY